MLTSEGSLVAKLYADVEDVKCNKKMVQSSVGGKFKVGVSLVFYCNSDRFYCFKIDINLTV